MSNALPVVPTYKCEECGTYIPINNENIAFKGSVNVIKENFADRVIVYDSSTHIFCEMECLLQWLKRQN